MTRTSVILIGLLFPLLSLAQGGEQQVRAKADGLFEEQRYAEAYPLYSQLVSLTPGDRVLNYRFGTCLLFGSAEKEQAITHLKFATEDPTIDPRAWYWMGRAYHLNYRFKEAQVAYQRFLGTADKKTLAEWPVDALMKQCRNGETLLSSLKEITVRSKVEVADAEFFRFYELTDMGGRIVVVPDELLSNLDKKKKERSVMYVPTGGGPIYFGSYGRDASTGKDIYRTEVLPDGTFAVPQKVAGYINTDQDEDFPFMHPDGKTFYFSSKGHNSMGGYDVFKAGYDRGLDAFGRPENMDFAVNTPDDDIFYIVDAEQKEACFASGRNSHQGMLHVYRVVTTQLPVVITVFKGTYASSFDPDDRKAHITVEDALTNDRVADVRTDLNGNYVLSVPRAGRYRYKVECGPTGRTHGGMVDVPTNSGPRAYRQELILDRTGDLEQLTIRNYFEDPLEDDLVALALDEIKRRARLDVTEDRPQVLAQVPVQSDDVMTIAGFTGDVDETKAIVLAREDASEQEAQAKAMQAQAEVAFGIAVEAASEADGASKRAADLLDRAGAATADDERNTLMTDASRERQRSREANLRARAAVNTGTALSATSLTARQRSLAAAKLATDVAAALGSGNKDQAVPLLRSLKERLDERSRPDRASEPAEAARNTLADHEKEVQRVMAAANAKRADENELTDRVARVKREREDARSKGRKEELDREITGLEQQLGFLRKETGSAFNNVAGMEKETAALRGQVSLTRHLEQATDPGPGTALSTEEAGKLAERISGVDARIGSLAIDERYNAQESANTAALEARSFNWDLVSATGAGGADRNSTRTLEQGAEGDARIAQSRATEVQQGTIAERTTTNVEVADVRVTPNERSEVITPRTTEPAVEPVVPEPRSGAQGSEQNATTDRFLLENERAELYQLAQAERDRAKRAELETRISAIDERLKTGPTTKSVVDEGSSTANEIDLSDADLTRPVLVFTGATKDEAIIDQLYRDYAGDRTRMEGIVDADERASGLNGLELMLADSLRAEMQRQVAVLQLAPQQAEVVLPRVDRLRRLRETHIQAGEGAIASRQQEVNGIQPTQPREASVPERTATRRMDGTDPIDDRFISIDRYAGNVFASKIEHRSQAKGVDDAVAAKNADLVRIDGLTTRIDSMERQLSGTPLGKDSDRMRKRIDQLIDERYIIRTDLGQRSAFLMQEEWKAAGDSLEKVIALTRPRGLAPDEPLLVMAQQMQAEAKDTFASAAQMRKRADRSENIIERDSLYRRAYRTELLALLAMDRAITVQNYLSGDKHQRGGSLTYEEVAAQVLGIEPVQARTEEIAEIKSGQPADGTIPAVHVDRSTVSNTSPDGTSRASEGSDAEQRIAAPVDTVAEPVTQAPTEKSNQRAPAVGSIEADAQTKAMLAAIEQRLGNKAYVSPQVYEQFLAGESTLVQPGKQDPDQDPDLLALRVERNAQAAADLEQRSKEATTRAEALADSATTARKRDREELERMAIRERALSDSLHQASIAEADAAQANEALRLDAEVSKRLRERLLKFYYITAEEQDMLLMDGDASRFFQMRTRALEQYQAADDAEAAASSNREVSQTLSEQVATTKRDAAAGRVPAEEANTRVRILQGRATALAQRADSLEVVAARLKGAAGINESQAGVLLQGLPAERSNELMALEMRTRRTETLLAEARSQAGAVLPSGTLPSAVVVVAPRQTNVPPTPVNEQPVDPTIQASTPSERAEVPSRIQARPTTTERPLPFRVPKELVEDIFALRDARVQREEPIPMDVPMPEGIVFKVQIGAFRNAVPVEAFSDMTPVMGETVAGGLVRYSAGLFTGFEQAAVAKDLVRDRGYRDAFVVAYQDGKRIPLGDAIRAERVNTSVAERPLNAQPQGRTVGTVQPATQEVRPAAVIQSPVTIPATSEPDIATILAAYPETVEEVVSRFAPAVDAASYYNVPGAAPAKQVETVKGLFFTVQVGVYSKPVPLGKLFNISPLNSERTATEKIRYTTGVYLDTEQARIRKDETVVLGVKDAFVTAYLNGKRIPMREATALLEKFGPAILAKP